MSGEEETPDTNDNPYSKYLQLLNSSSEHAEATNDELDWSEDEKDRFFAALSSYSLLRPDLISEAVGTKNVAQVAVYLSTLEDAANDCDVKLLRSDFDIAMEVSDEWLEVEEEQAAFLRDIELAWKKDEDQRNPEPSSQEVDVEIAHMRTEALKNLSLDHFKVIDKILRNDAKPEPSLTSVQETQAGAAAAELSPAERRRLQKRLHMRKKRAELAGTTVVTDVHRLQRGRKRKNVTQPQPSSRTSSHFGSEREKSAEREQEYPADEVRPEKKERKRGLTKEQKVAEIFEELGIDSAVIHEQTLDLFHLRTLGRLLALNQEASPDSEISVSAVSSDTIRLLHAVLADYVTRLIHCTIILREQALQLRGHTKAWRDKTDAISPDIVEKAVSMLGHPATKAEAFEHFFGGEYPDDDQMIVEPVDGAESGSEGSDDDDPSTSSCTDSLTISPYESNPPLISLPARCSDIMDPSTLADTDEEMLDEELEEDEALDEQDQALEKVLMGELWAAHMQNMAALNAQS
ncbi:hypothetical protein F5878DRAFT_657182 [Lentinula raphanica]|uniref:Myb-like domain-containing protein n=1 Tax=Lentinula raphanica TaxID=153919 RepID=A0AA38PHB5_9AGAR|nr:hypothetical protein F5878DRAFT_657182 [Lentinula raphanica]